MPGWIGTLLPTGGIRLKANCCGIDEGNGEGGTCIKLGVPIWIFSENFYITFVLLFCKISAFAVRTFLLFDCFRFSLRQSLVALNCKVSFFAVQY